MERLERRFQNALAALVRAARPRRGDRDARLLALIRESGGVTAARQVLAEPASAEPELNVEALVLDPEWGCLFTDEERALARVRLLERGQHSE